MRMYPKETRERAMGAARRRVGIGFRTSDFGEDLISGAVTTEAVQDFQEGCGIVGGLGGRTREEGAEVLLRG